jgi:4-hydroxythreonine-4-phosphate dehydrogenase
MTRAPRLAITMGDPAGIGPEIIVKAAHRLAPRLAAGEFTVLVIGSLAALDRARAAFADAPSFAAPRAGAPLPALGMLAADTERAPIPLGEVSAECGRLAYLAVARAVELALSPGADPWHIDAIVTAPLNKEALNLAGYHYAGHTDMLAALTGTKSSVMLLAHGPMRVSHVSTHVALADVPKLLTPDRLRRVIDLTRAALIDLGIALPRIAVAALNPHAGEGGLLGREDIEVTMPIVARCVAEGLDVIGPVPGDTVFVKLRGGQYDAVVAMYHDQGHIPVKLLGFDVDPATGRWRALSGVNITLGLPIVRTSVDHGTAFDIAGRGIASEESLIEAIDVALAMAATRATQPAAAA